MRARDTRERTRGPDRPAPDNTYVPVITGWKLWAICTFLVSGDGAGTTYRDPAFPACPRCHSPNVRLLRTRRNRPHRYQCIERNCRSRGTCEFEGSTGIEAHRAQIRMVIITLVIIAAMAAMILSGHGSMLNSGGG